MEALFFVVVPTGLLLWLLASLGYWLAVAAANVTFRLVSGRWFRWLSWRTVAPWALLLLAAMAVAYLAWSDYGGPK